MQIFPRIVATAKSVLRRLGLLPLVGRLLARLLALGDRVPAAKPLAHFIRHAQEQASFVGVTDVHDLPPIHHYWSNTYLLPKVRQFGFAGPDEFFANHLERSLAAGRTSRFLSIAAGNCDTEIRVAEVLRSRGHERFVIECLDLNPAMLGRGQDAALRRGLSAQLAWVEADFNAWRPQGRYDAIIANQALHHVAGLEHLFDAVAQAIAGHGRFVISDMIGRNGHLRWPEALAIVQEFWRELPQSHRYNCQLRRREPAFLDWDSSVSGYEGIRAQDILPLLIERFQFEVFVPFANVIDPFIGRAFGPNFDPGIPWDREFIDRVHARDEQELLAGRVKPTHVFAVVQTQPPEARQYLEGFCPEKSVRPPIH